VLKEYRPEILLSSVSVMLLTLSLVDRVFGFWSPEVLFDVFSVFSKNQFFLPVVLLFVCLVFLGLRKDWLRFGQLVGYILYIFVSLYAYAVGLQWVFQNVPTDRVVLSTIRLLEWDHAVFHSYIFFALQSLIGYPLEMFPVEAYWLLSTIISTTALLLLAKGKMFREFMFSMLTLSLISLPIWYAFPATSPSGFIRSNIFEVRFPKKVLDSGVKNNLSPYMQVQLENLETLWIEPTQGYINVSTIPSLHAGYGVVVLVFLARLRKYTLWFTVPWFLLNALGAVYIEQHFGLDIIAGVILATLTMFLTTKLYRKRQGIPFYIH